MRVWLPYLAVLVYGDGMVGSAGYLDDLGSGERGHLLALGVLLHEQRDLQRGVLVTEFNLNKQKYTLLLSYSVETFLKS